MSGGLRAYTRTRPDEDLSPWNLTRRWDLTRIRARATVTETPNAASMTFKNELLFARGNAVA
jgi:hypothetical protein